MTESIFSQTSSQLISLQSSNKFLAKGLYYTVNATIKYKYSHTRNNIKNKQPYAISIIIDHESKDTKLSNELPILWDISAFRPNLTVINDKLEIGVKAKVFYENYESLISNLQYKIPRYILIIENNINSDTGLLFINIR